jgi:hypothetical protein
LCCNKNMNVRGMAKPQSVPELFAAETSRQGSLVTCRTVDQEPRIRTADWRLPVRC